MMEVSVRHLGPDTLIEFVAKTVIEKPADHLYALVDLGDERNESRQLGEQVTALDDEGLRYRHVIPCLQDQHFDYEVIEALKPSVYGYSGVSTPRTGYLERLEQRYAIEPVGAEMCNVTLQLVAQFEAGLNACQIDKVKRHMTIACHNTLAKLKANAEHGVGSVDAAVNTQLMPVT